jgi:hypothetical protein
MYKPLALQRLNLLTRQWHHTDIVYLNFEKAPLFFQGFNNMSRFLFFLLVLISFNAAGQSNWVLKKDEGGMKIYTGASANSKLKALRVEYALQASLSQLAAVLLDVNAQPKWVYSTKSSSVLKKISANEIVSYSEKSFPTPFSNRDVVTNVKITQNPATKVMTVNVTGVPDHIPGKKNLVRVPFSKAVWTVTPVDKGRLKVEYIAEADPGGSIPAWISNMFLTKGPYESFKKLAVIIQQPEYKNAKISFINN